MFNPKSIEQQIHAIRSQLKDFSSPTTKAKTDVFRYRHRLSGDYEMLRLVRFVFSDVLQFKIGDTAIPLLPTAREDILAATEERHEQDDALFAGQHKFTPFDTASRDRDRYA